jgi:hypothetical protein
MSNERWRYDPFAPPPSLTGAVQPPAVDDEPDVALPDGLDDLRKAELVALAGERGLDTSGTRAELIARLRASA